MGQFTYTVLTPDGKRTSGLLTAPDMDTATKVLSEKNLVVTKLNPARTSVNKFLRLLGFGIPRVKGEDLLIFTQELGAMLNAGIPLKSAMDVLVADVEKSDMRKIVVELSFGLSSGKMLSDVLKEYPETFDKMYVAMVASGETGGKLPSVLLRLASYIENAETLRKRVQGAFYYPGIVLTFACFIMAFIFAFGIPRLASIYSGLGAQLPLPTRIFISIGMFLSHAWPVLLPTLIVVALILLRLSRTPGGQLFVDNMKLNGVIIGPLFRRLAIARFARSLSSLYLSGVPILKALELTATSMGNAVMEAMVLHSLQKVREGESITAPLRRSKLFPQMATSMIAAGEESGALDTMLDRLADFYETQVNLSLYALTGVMEPLIMILVGIFIGTVIVVLALPFLQLGAVLH